MRRNTCTTDTKAEIEDRRPSDKSMMPDDLLSQLGDHEVRSLVAYSRAAQGPMLATAENVTSFFNGRDLTGWQGEPALWSVENGEIVGKTAGLKHNTFLRSDLLCSDFKLTLQVKLVANQGNSGIQFRSQAAPNDEVKGYQADIGPTGGARSTRNSAGACSGKSRENGMSRWVSGTRMRSSPSARRSRRRSTGSLVPTSTIPPAPAAGSSPSSSTRGARPKSATRTSGSS